MKKLITILATASACMAASHVTAATWTNQIGGRGADVVYAVTETRDGRLCASGTAWSGSRIGRGNDEVVLDTDDAQQMFVACYQRGGDIAFVTPLLAGRADAPHAMLSLPEGDLLLTGRMETENGDADAFVRRFDRHGKEVWSQQFGGALADSGNALSVGKDGAIFLAAGFEDRLTWRDGERLAKIHSVGSRDAAVMRLNEKGEVIWASRYGGAGFDEASVLQARRTGGVLVGGTFRGLIDVGEAQLESRGYRDVVVAAYGAAGKLEWVAQFGGPGQDTVRGLVEDDRGQITVVGNFHGTIRMADDQVLKSAGSTDVFVARLDATGALHHAASFGGPLTDQVFDLAINRHNQLILAGHYQGETDLAPGPLVAQIAAPSQGNSSGYVLVLDQNADYVNAQTVAGAGVEMILGVHALGDGNIAIAGLFNKDLTVNSGSISLNARGKTDIFVARMRLPGALAAPQQSILRRGSVSPPSLSW